MYWKDIEVAVIEVKPIYAYDRLAELDEVRLGGLTKKLLHKRMATAKSKEEFCTFSIGINDPM